MTISVRHRVFFAQSKTMKSGLEKYFDSKTQKLLLKEVEKSFQALKGVVNLRPVRHCYTTELRRMFSFVT